MDERNKMHILIFAPDISFRNNVRNLCCSLDVQSKIYQKFDHSVVCIRCHMRIVNTFYNVIYKSR